MEPQRILPYFILKLKPTIRTQKYACACVVLVRRCYLFFLQNAKHGVCFKALYLNGVITKTLNHRRFYIISFIRQKQLFYSTIVTNTVIAISFFFVFFNKWKFWNFHWRDVFMLIVLIVINCNTPLSLHHTSCIPFSTISLTI